MLIVTKSCVQLRNYLRCSLKLWDIGKYVTSFTLCFKNYSTTWDVDPMWLFHWNCHFSNFFDMVQYVIEEGKNLELFVVLTWTIWYRRNQIRATKTSLNHSSFPKLYKLSKNFIRSLLVIRPNLPLHIILGLGGVHLQSHLWRSILMVLCSSKLWKQVWEWSSHSYRKKSHFPL